MRMLINQLHFICTLHKAIFCCLLLQDLVHCVVPNKIIHLDLENNLNNEVCTVHYFQAIVEDFHFMDVFLNLHQSPDPSNPFPWTISHSTRLHTNHVENYTGIKINTQLLQYTGHCNVVILMKVKTLFGWYPDIIPVTPCTKPTLVLAFWEYNAEEDNVIRQHLKDTQRYVSSMARNNEVILLFTIEDKTFTGIKRVELLCYYCPGALIEYSLQELVQHSGNGISTVVVPRLLENKLAQDNANLWGKPKGVFDSTLKGLAQGDFNFNALRGFKLRRKLKVQPFLNVINELACSRANFTPILLTAPENQTGGSTKDLDWRDVAFSRDKIWCDFLDMRIYPHERFLNFISVRNVFKRVIYCEDKLIIKSQVKRFALWLTPFDYSSWMGIIVLFGLTWLAIESMGYLELQKPSPPEQITLRKFVVFPLIYTAFRKSVFPKLDRIHLVLVLGYFVIISGYEAVITSRVIAPETPFVYGDYLSLFESGFKLYCYLVKWKGYEEHRDVLEVVEYLNSTQRFKRSKYLSLLSRNKSMRWWIEGRENINLESNLSEIMSGNKLALPIQDSIAEHTVLKLTSNSSKFCHLIPPKIQTGREVWLFEGEQANVKFLMKIFGRIFESGIPSLFYTNYNWIVHEMGYKRDLARTKVKGHGGGGPKALSLGGKWAEIFYLCALGLLAGGFTFVIEMWRNKNISKNKRRRVEELEVMYSQVIVVSAQPAVPI